MTEVTDTIYCNICQKPLDEARARRMTAVCSEACKDKLEALRLRQRAATKCPYCRHPASPEEREAFRLWRAERGDIRSAEKQVRDHSLPQKRTIAQVLRKAVSALDVQRDRLRTGDFPSDEEAELSALIAEAEALLNPNPAPKAPRGRKKRSEAPEAHPEAENPSTGGSIPGTRIPAEEFKTGLPPKIASRRRKPAQERSEALEAHPEAADAPTGDSGPGTGTLNEDQIGQTEVL